MARRESMIWRLRNAWARMWMRVSLNQYGVLMSHHICKSCKSHFTVTPAVEEPLRWEHCLAAECKSYNPHRDANVMMGEPPPPGKPISLEARRAKVERT